MKMILFENYDKLSIYKRDIDEIEKYLSKINDNYEKFEVFIVKCENFAKRSEEILRKKTGTKKNNKCQEIIGMCSYLKEYIAVIIKCENISTGNSDEISVYVKELDDLYKKELDKMLSVMMYYKYILEMIIENY